MSLLSYQLLYPAMSKIWRNIQNSSCGAYFHRVVYFLNTQKFRTIHFVHSDNAATEFNGSVPKDEQHYNF